MHRMNPDCWLWSPRRPLCLHPQHSGAVLKHQEDQEEDEEEEGEAGEDPAVCCYAAGCERAVSQAADVQWSPSEPPIPRRSPLAGQGPGAHSPQQPKTVINADGGDVSQHFIGGHRWEDSGVETQGCVCVYGQREPEGLGPCWPGSPYIYYGVRRNVVVGVEVVEEVAVEDTLEVITEDIYTDHLLDPELLQDPQLYPT